MTDNIKIYPSLLDVKNSMLNWLSETEYQLLNDSSVVIAGLGGLGSHISVLLARTGVGHIHLIDFDTVDLSNINRQAYKLSQLNMFKTDALKEIIYEINPYIDITMQNIRINEYNVEKIFKPFNLICEAFDNAEDKALLVNKVLEIYPFTKIVASSGMAGFMSSNIIKTNKINERLYICGDNVRDIDVCGNLTAARVSLCAAHQANMIIRLILGINEA